jgi:hypothetical protein
VPGALSAANPDEGTINALAWPILNLSLILFALTGAGLFGRFLLRIGKEEGGAGSELPAQPEPSAAR